MVCGGGVVVCGGGVVVCGGGVVGCVCVCVCVCVGPKSVKQNAWPVMYALLYSTGSVFMVIQYLRSRLES